MCVCVFYKIMNKNPDNGMKISLRVFFSKKKSTVQFSNLRQIFFASEFLYEIININVARIINLFGFLLFSSHHLNRKKSSFCIQLTIYIGIRPKVLVVLLFMFRFLSL